MTASQWVAAHRQRQGLPPTITAGEVLARLAGLLLRKEAS